MEQAIRLYIAGVEQLQKIICTSRQSCVRYGTLCPICPEFSFLTA